jgi:hypothetical protein
MSESARALGVLTKKYMYDFDKLVYIIFPFGEKGHELEFMDCYDWQLNEGLTV